MTGAHTPGHKLQDWNEPGRQKRSEPPDFEPAIGFDVMQIACRLASISVSLGIGGLTSLPGVTFAAPSNPIRPVAACPTDLEALTAVLLRDLPSYANRVVQRSLEQSPTGEGVASFGEHRPGTILLAGRPEFEPLSLGAGAYTPTPIQPGQPRQVFFTTLERQYVGGQIVRLQHYHWIFLAPGDRGWLFVAMFSQLGDAPPNQPPTPPQDTSQGAIAQAIRLWLRDCQSGDVLP